jgi:hypothetical protein
MYRTVDSTRPQSIYSTNSLAVASVLLAVSAVVAGLSPILHPAFLPVSLLGMIVAVFGMFSCRDRSGLQIGALAVNGFVMLLALLMGPRMSSTATAESLHHGWGSMFAVEGERLQGRLHERTWQQMDDGSSRLGLSIVWDTSNLSGYWNWIDGVVQLSNLDGDEVLKMDWRISEAATSASGSMTRSGDFVFDETSDQHRWLTATANSRIKVQFIPTQWEHEALTPQYGRLRPILAHEGPGHRLVDKR